MRTQKLTLASNDESPRLPFSNPEKYHTQNIADHICGLG
jgi:hypothetical protein